MSDCITTTPIVGCFTPNNTALDAIQMYQHVIYEAGQAVGQGYSLNNDTEALIDITTYLGGGVWSAGECKKIRTWLGSEKVGVITNNSDSVLSSIPAGATHAEIEPWGEVIHTTVGISPDAATFCGFRHNDGHKFELQSLSELQGFRVRSLRAGFDAHLYVEYFNCQEHN